MIKIVLTPIQEAQVQPYWDAIKQNPQQYSTIGQVWWEGDETILEKVIVKVTLISRSALERIASILQEPGVFVKIDAPRSDEDDRQL